MKSSEIIYKFLTFLLINIVVIIILFTLFFKFINYKSDFELFKEKFASIKGKEQGSLYNHLKYYVFSYINPYYLKNLNLNFLYYNIKPYESYNSKLLYFLEDNYNLEDKLYLICYEFLNSNPEECERVINQVVHRSDFNFNKINDYLVINSANVDNKRDNKNNDEENYINAKFYYYKGVFLFPNVLSQIVVNRNEENSFIFDNSINIRFISYKGYTLFSTLLMKPNENVNFYYDPDLAIRIFYSPKDFSKEFIKDYLNKLKNTIVKGEISNNYLSSVFKYNNNYYLAITQKEAYKLGKLNLKLNSEQCKESMKNGFIIYYFFKYKILDPKFIIEACSNLLVDNFEFQENFIIIPFLLKDRELNDEFFNLIQDYHLSFLLTNSFVNNLLEKVNYCKNNNIDFGHCFKENKDLFGKLSVDSLKTIKAISPSNLPKTIKLLKEKDIISDFNQFLTLLRLYLIIQNSQITNNKVKIINLENLQYGVFSNKKLLKEIKEIREFSIKNRSFIELIEKLKEFYNNLDDEEVKDLIDSNLLFMQTNKLFNYYILNKDLIKNYLSNKKIFIYPTSIKTISPSLVFYVDRIKEENNKWFIEVKDNN
ncbi:MAG: hypothetical protein ABGW69_04130 [Nanoarchaeota archaeon]